MYQSTITSTGKFKGIIQLVTWSTCQLYNYNGDQNVKKYG